MYVNLYFKSKRSFHTESHYIRTKTFTTPYRNPFSAPTENLSLIRPSSASMKLPFFLRCLNAFRFILQPVTSWPAIKAPV